MHVAENCQCGSYKDFPKIEAYCSYWFMFAPAPYCLLKGGLSAANCPNARKLTGKDIFQTSDESICNASIGELSGLFGQAQLCQERKERECGDLASKFPESADCVEITIMV